jgi:hypothetical protein
MVCPRTAAAAPRRRGHCPRRHCRTRWSAYSSPNRSIALGRCCPAIRTTAPDAF